ncbi:hypothetical protein CKO27_01560 [Thiocystis violacea]|nr:hypothetical protein [Thiocystis violacea]
MPKGVEHSKVTEMDLRQIAEALNVPRPILLTGRQGRPVLTLVKPAPKPTEPKQPEPQGQ